MLQNSRQNPKKKAEKIFKNGAKPHGYSKLPILVVAVLLRSPYHLTIKKIQDIIRLGGHAYWGEHGIHNAINHLHQLPDLYTLDIKEVRAGNSHAKAFKLTINNSHKP